jgi:hypothetical protein
VAYSLKGARGYEHFDCPLVGSEFIQCILTYRSLAMQFNKFKDEFTVQKQIAV